MTGYLFIDSVWPHALPISAWLLGHKPFNSGTFDAQMAVMRGQMTNLIVALKVRIQVVRSRSSK